MNESEVSVPLSVRLRFGHAAVQHLADEIGVDLLHIKGVAVDPSLRSYASGTDVDVLIRPGDVDLFHRVMLEHGWRVHTTFELGSPFGHAQTYSHDVWGFMDAHRFFPGIRLDPAKAFQRLWSDRRSLDLAGIACSVPSVPAQALLLILNAARSPAAGWMDVRSAWTEASPERRADIEQLVAQLDAPVAFAVVTGGFERYRRERDYRLWRVVSRGGSRSAEWWARVWAAPDFRAAVRIAARAPLVNIEHLALRLGRRPTRRDIAVEFVSRPARAFREWRHAVARRRPAP